MAGIADWLGTLRQALPQIGVMVRHMRPWLELPDVASIDQKLLESLGIQAVIWDVDGTLMPRHAPDVAERFRDAFQRVVSAPDVQHLILSNADEARYRELGTIFPDIPVLRAYATPEGIVGRVLFRGDDSLSPAELRGYLSAGVRALRKPSAELMEVALEQLRHPPRDAVLMVGDQYMTDIAGANLAGLRSLKVRTHAPTSFPVPIRALQYLEQLGYRVFHERRRPRSLSS
jgi:predicted HAD superfamily phosphohydrolase YqeG